jgi:EAL domain-containing protein (putative c-di-GMP-specific phosphodiesterase class I)/GGDEF domain-containing protein
MSATPPDPTANRFRYSLLLREIDRMRGAARDSAVALLLIQLSGLDLVNSRFGYLGGDKVVEEFTRRLRAVPRAEDRVLEVNSRTFALLVHNPLHEGHVVLAADKVARAALEPVVIGTGRVCVKAHIGISLLPHPAGGGEELLRQSEIALEASRSRDEPHVLFTPGLLTFAGRAPQHAWFDVEEALRAGEFAVFYQPQIDLRSGELTGSEALIRWRKEGSGWIAPGAFLPALEHSQGIRAILQFVLNAALRQAAGWSAKCAGFAVSVNVAAGNLADPDLVELVDDALSVWSLAPAQLTLEITESSLMDNPVASARVLGRLRALGVRTSIDDFGTGYSSLAYLRDLPADELKVDRSFVSRILGGARDRDIVASIVQLAHAVDLSVVAEGIEEPATLAALAAMGCDYGQGYHFGKPVPAAEFQGRWIDPGGGASQEIA